jgi:M-phase inducer tyrosine phosphatase
MNSAMNNGALSLSTLVEDGNTTIDGDDTDTDLGDSPCPPPTKTVMLMKAKKLGARGMVRSETYGPSRMNY